MVALIGSVVVGGPALACTVLGDSVMTAATLTGTTSAAGVAGAAGTTFAGGATGAATAIGGLTANTIVSAATAGATGAAVTGGCATTGAIASVGATVGGAAGSGALAGAGTAVSSGAALGSGATAMAATSAFLASPLGLAVVGADEGNEIISWDCWKKVVRDTTLTPSLGRTLRDIASDPNICKCELIDNSRLLMTNQWSEMFVIYPVMLAQGECAYHAERATIVM